MTTETVRAGLTLTGRWAGGRAGSQRGYYGNVDCGGLSPEEVSTLDPEVQRVLEGLAVGAMCSFRVAPRTYQGNLSWSISEVLAFQPALAREGK